MLSKLRNFIKQSCTSSSICLSKYNVDETHNSVKLDELFQNYDEVIQEKKDQIIQEIMNGLNGENWVYDIKCHMVVHHFIIHGNEEMRNMFLTVVFQSQIEKGKDQQEEWIRKQVINPYHNYLMKLALNPELIKCYDDDESKQLFKTMFMQQIHKRFKVLNIMKYIIQLQTSFCKCGRYFPNYLIVFQLYKMYLNDVKVYYNNLKLTIQQVFQSQSSLNNQQIIHAFYFVNEALAVSDRQYQLFHNRYYYPKMQNYVFPVIYVLSSKKYRHLQRNLQSRKIFIDSYVRSDKQNRKICSNKTITTSQYETNQTIQNFKTFADLGQCHYEEEVEQF